MEIKENELLKLAMEQDFRDTLENELAKNQNKNRKVKIIKVQVIGEINRESKDNLKKPTELLYQVDKEIIEREYMTGRERKTQTTSIYLGNKCIAGKVNDEIIFDEKFKEKELEKSEEIKELVKNNEKADEGNLSEKQTKEIEIKGIQKVDLNRLVDGKESLGKRLDLSEYNNLLIVYSDKVDEVAPGTKRNNTKYSLIGITKEGKAKVLNDEFEIDSSVGNSGTRQQTKVKDNGVATRDNKNISVYRRKSNGASIGCENYIGNIDMYFYQKTKEENENVGIQIETSQTKIIKKETRDVMNRNKGINNKERVQDEIEEHVEKGCNPKDVKDFDGDENTATHIHLSQEELETYSQEILKYESIQQVFTKNEVQERLEKEISEKEKELTLEQIIEFVKDDMEQDANNFNREHKL